MQLRPAEPDDALAIARVHVRAWQTAYRGLLADDYLDQLRPEDRAQKYDFANPNLRAPQTIVATDRDIIQGFATTAPSREPDLPHHGELIALYVDPDSWGQGFGIALVSLARARLCSLGLRKAYLWVVVGNFRAERFYHKDRWSPDGLRRTDTVWGIQVDALRYQRDL